MLGLVVGYRVTSRERILPARLAPPETGFARVLYRKYFVDEIYQALIVRPVVWLSERVLWRTVDQAIVDGVFVHGGVWLGSRLQNGQVGVYLILFLVGAIWVLYAVAG
ncbi:MAG: hypothetical protein C4345_00810 [Chloroflexota bacterium]